MKRKVEKSTNISIVCLDYFYAVNVAKILAEQLDMYFLDTFELFKFDIAPNSLSEYIKIYGMKNFRKDQSGNVKYCSSFENTIMTFESGVVDNNINIKNIDKKGLLIFLNLSNTKIKNNLEKQNYTDKTEKKLLFPTEIQMMRRKERIKKYADITLNCTNFGQIKCSAEILRKIKEYYGVN